MTRRAAIKPTRAAATKASEAADTLMAWLGAQSGGETQTTPLAPSTAAEAICNGSESSAAGGTGLQNASYRPATAKSDWGSHDGRAALRLAHTDWLHHRLQIRGPAPDLSAFRAAAAGAGTVPWQLDLDRTEEDLFHLLVARRSRSLSLPGARILAGQLCAAVAHRHALAVARVGQSCACPLDLHALVPVPDAVLRHGPDDPEAVFWLWAHWGTTQTLRHVVEEASAGAALAGRAPSGEAVWVVTFWSADWTPWHALKQIASDWPMLHFNMRPIYDAP